MMDQERWWQRCVSYEIFPRSFQDTNGNGIGDIPGIIMRLPYLKKLGVGCLWIASIFFANDFLGEEVMDYRAVDPVLGSMSDVDALIAEAHRLSIKIVLEMPIGHTSARHAWFLESRKGGSSNPYQDFYLWTDTTCNWVTIKSDGALTWDSSRNAAFVHTYGENLPDLNWRDEHVVKAMYDQCRFWLEKGVDGLEFHDVNTIIKDETFRDNPSLSMLLHPRSYERQLHVFDRNRPESHRELRRLHAMVGEYDNRLMAGDILQEKAGESEIAASYVGDQLDITFDDALMRLPFRASAWRWCAQRWYQAVGENGWPAWRMESGKDGRIVDRWKGNDGRARIAAMFLLTQKGMPLLYYGQEIGLCSKAKETKEGKVHTVSWRPMVWTDQEGHGFTTGTPWLPWGNAASSVAHGETDADSLFSLYRRLIALRNEDSVLQAGTIHFLDSGRHGVLAYCRQLGEEKRIILLNFRSRHSEVRTDAHTIMLSTSSMPTWVRGKLVLGPYQGVILKA